jgi:hypothetical protein
MRWKLKYDSGMRKVGGKIPCAISIVCHITAQTSRCIFVSTNEDSGTFSKLAKLVDFKQE